MRGFSNSGAGPDPTATGAAEDKARREREQAERDAADDEQDDDR
ncbi:MAG: hypothetical protein JWQ81_6053 [Amycolatopsis sp.]|nr:hypothetical protein [Amycolatopsis sp.]MCU1685314.1 hypothetical protein [Amycolatopsis sp.]